MFVTTAFKCDRNWSLTKDLNLQGTLLSLVPAGYGLGNTPQTPYASYVYHSIS